MFRIRKEIYLILNQGQRAWYRPIKAVKPVRTSRIGNLFGKGLQRAWNRSKCGKKASWATRPRITEFELQTTQRHPCILWHLREYRWLYPSK